jgi:hypothetical protein
MTVSAYSLAIIYGVVVVFLGSILPTVYLDLLDRNRVAMRPDKVLQTDKVNLSCLLHPQKSRQLAFAAELGR